MDKKTISNIDLNKKIFLLNPDVSQAEAVSKFRSQRKKSTILAIFTGILLVVAMITTNTMKKAALCDIKRGTYGEDSKIITRTFQVDNYQKQDVDIEVFSQEYTNQEAQKMIDEAQRDLSKLILGNNISLQEIRYSMNLPKTLYDAVSISWLSSVDSVIDSSGRINNLDVAEEGQEVTLEYKISCSEVSRTGEIKIRVLPPDFSPEEAMNAAVIDEVKHLEKFGRGNSLYSLPKEVNGKHIKWSTNSENVILPIILLGFVPPVLVYKLKERQLDNALKTRSNQLARDYYEIAGKLILFVGAGVSIKRSFLMMADDYLKRKESNNELRYAYEEIAIMCREIKSGVPEITAYENCAGRLGLLQYKKLFGYVIQSVKKGSGYIGVKLKTELQEAFEIRKANAIRQGEEAASKLMLPMLMMLGIIIAVLLIPAFISFGI